MVIVLELAGMALLLGVVLILFKAANARPEARDLRVVAWIGVAVWVIYVAVSLVDVDYISQNWAQILRASVGVGVVLAIVLGYRAVLRQLRARHDAD